MSGFYKLNKILNKHKPWHLPKIVKILQELEGFAYASHLDLNMG